jgi:hypothetical protein
MKRRTLFQALTLAPILWSVTAVAAAAETQANPASVVTVSRGQRVRVAAPLFSKERITGTLVGEDPAAIWIDTGKGVAIVPRSNVDALEISHGRGSRAKGLLVGAVAGVGTLFALGYLAFRDDFDVDLGAVTTAPATYVLAGTGALVGARISSREAWKAASGGHLTPQVASRRPEVALKVTLTF